MATYRRHVTSARLNAEIRRLLRAGWRVSRGRKHVKLRTPGGALIVLSGTPSDPRSERNELARIRRAEREGQ
jgi:hypothetical protein